MNHAPGVKDFYEYFKELSNPDDISLTPDEDVYEYLNQYQDRCNKINHSMYEELNCAIECEEVEKAIKDLKCGKAAGHDMLINEIYIYACETLAPKLTCLFNIVFNSGYFPSSWSDGIIIPLHKKGSTQNVGNYRGITLLSTLGKLFTRVLNNRLNFW